MTMGGILTEDRRAQASKLIIRSADDESHSVRFDVIPRTTSVGKTFDQRSSKTVRSLDFHRKSGRFSVRSTHVTQSGICLSSHILFHFDALREAFRAATRDQDIR